MSRKYFKNAGFKNVLFIELGPPSASFLGFVLAAYKNYGWRGFGFCFFFSVVWEIGLGNVVYNSTILF